MGVEVDSLYKQNLTEWVYDEQKLITYRYLSVTLGVHVNIAKQMLYEFYNEERKKEKQKRSESNNNTTGAGIQALFYISGLKTNSSDAGGATSAFVSALCRDDQVESVKKGFRRISSLHIYSIQLLQLENNGIIDKLSNAMKETSLLAHEDGRSVVDFGPFKLQIATKINPVPKAPAPTASAAPATKAGVKAKPFEVAKKPDVKQSIFGRSTSKTVEKPAAEEEEKSETVEKEKPKTSTTKPSDSSVKKNVGNQSDRLKNMFAAAASKPKKPPQAKIVDSEEESSPPPPARVVKKEPPKTYGRNNAKNKNKPKEVETTRKRKRVVDILSSSEEEEEEVEEKRRPNKRSIRISSDEEDSLPESPIPRKRAPVIIDSDSESDMFQSPKKEKGKLNFVSKPKEKSPPPPESSGSGRRKVKKTVTKSHVDEDGFTVTTKTQEWVSASESDEEKKAEKSPQKADKSTHGIVNDKEKKNPISSAFGGAKKAVASVPSPAKNKSASTPNSKKTPAASGPKTKQPTLMSFFTKKT